MRGNLAPVVSEVTASVAALSVIQQIVTIHQPCIAPVFNIFPTGL